MLHTIISLSLAAALSVCCLKSAGQPVAVKKASGAVFRLTTYKVDGTVLAEGAGVFTSADGTAIAALQPFDGAARATVNYGNGRQAEVERVCGVSELYDLAKIKVDVDGVTALPVTTASAKVGDAVWLVPAGEGSRPVEATVKAVETFGGEYSYYIFGFTAPDGSASCPFVTADGRLLGLMKPASATADVHAADARFALGLATNGFAISDPLLRRIGIPPALPADVEQARLVLIMAEQGADTLKRRAAAVDFIGRYPALTDGYSAMARLQVEQGHCADAATTMAEAIRHADRKDQAHADYGKLVYDYVMYAPAESYAPWTLALAAAETAEAYKLNPLPAYRHQQARITFAQGDYKAAYDEFTALMATDMPRPELLYEAARCKARMGAPGGEVIALLDSAINTTDTLRMRETAPYFLARAEAYAAEDSFRQAVFDYTRYELLTASRPGAEFYAVRARTEVKARLYQQALGDYARAMLLAPGEPTYYAEMAQLQLRVGHSKEAVETARRCTEMTPDYSDGHLLLGLALITTGDKPAGLAALKKADELGNPQAQPLIDKYSKDGE